MGTYLCRLCCAVLGWLLHSLCPIHKKDEAENPWRRPRMGLGMIRCDWRKYPREYKRILHMSHKKNNVGNKPISFFFIGLHDHWKKNYLHGRRQATVIAICVGLGRLITMWKTKRYWCFKACSIKMRAQRHLNLVEIIMMKRNRWTMWPTMFLYIFIWLKSLKKYFTWPMWICNR